MVCEESDEDDTIALSGDELNNILTSAQFTAENIEPQNPDLDEPVDFGGKELEEPAFDETEPEQEETEENIPDEISVPKADDILVESSATDMMDAPVRTDETVATEPQDFSAEPEEVESIEETEPVEEAESAEEPEVISEDIPEAQETAYSSAEETVEKETEQQPQETSLESLSKPIDVFKEDDEVLEKGIGEEPVGEVFSNWQSKDETPDTEDIPETEDVADKKEIPAPAAEEKNDDSSDIPSDMKQEIKSVLSYCRVCTVRAVRDIQKTLCRTWTFLTLRTEAKHVPQTEYGCIRFTVPKKRLNVLQTEFRVTLTPSIFS